MACMALPVPLSAQEAGSPVPLGGKALDLPAGWMQAYEVPEVMIRIAVMPDSSLQLIGILDGKNELATLVEEHLRLYPYLLQSEQVLPGQQITAILRLNQPVSASSGKASEQETLKRIEAWIESYKERHSLHGNGGDLWLYRSGFSFTGWDDPGNRNTMNGFERPGSAFSPALYDGLNSEFYQPSATYCGVGFTDVDYPYPIAVSELQTGLGDYEHRLAHGSIRKNGVFGVDGLYLGYEFIAQNGYLAEIGAAQTSMKFDLKLPLWGTQLRMAYTDHASDLAMTELSPEYWQPALFTIDHRLRRSMVQWLNPWLNLALNYESERARSNLFSSNLFTKTVQVKAFRSLTAGPLVSDLKYEHAFKDQNFTRTDNDYDDLIQAGLNLKGMSLRFSLYDFEVARICGSYLQPLGSLSLGVFTRMGLSQPEAIIRVADIYTGIGTLGRIDKQERGRAGLEANWSLDPKLEAGLRAGIKRTATTDAGGETEADAVFADLKGKADWKRGHWKLAWEPALAWQYSREDIAGEPGLLAKSDLILYRDLGYDNALFAGFSVIGHSGYLSSLPSGIRTDASAVVDLIAGVQISKRFELNVSYKNIGNSSLFGIYPVPASLQASLRWFYLN
jgi:hypothetical protein